MITNFDDWILVTEGLYLYKIKDNIRYELYIKYCEPYTNILKFPASLYISGTYHTKKILAGRYFNRNLLLESHSIGNCIAYAQKHYNEYFS